MSTSDVTPKRRVAVAGATGYIGGRLVPRLLEAGFIVRCLARSPSKLSERDWISDPGVEVFPVEMSNSSALSEALNGVDSAFYLVHSMASAGATYAKRDELLARQFAASAQAAAVKRIIYLGGLGETGANLSEHLSSRREVESALASAGVPVTVLRAAVIVGSGSASFEILRYLVERLPVMITPRWVSTLCQPIAVRDVISYLLGVLDKPETIGQVFDIGGPDVLRYRDILRIMAEELRLPRRLILPVPLLTPRLSSYWIHLITPIGHSMAKPLAEGLKNPVVCRENRISDLLPQPLLSVREAIRAALTTVAENRVATSWSMAGPMPGDPDWAGGSVFRDARELTVAASASAVFRAVCRVGGGHGWYAADWLWKLRGLLDRLVGGPGLRRGRRDPESVGFGEALDFWRVVGLERDRRLALRAEMKLPGEALLEFCIEDQGDGQSLLRQTALFRPRGVFGLLYWYAVVPLHGIVFSGMLSGIRAEALRLAAGGDQPRALSVDLCEAKE
ncbi:MAG: SDR family oxidoreductase [Acidobacteria bacterium]|nr:SDR family oxidoreductase [Acidobacteriota bacterium]